MPLSINEFEQHFQVLRYPSTHNGAVGAPEMAINAFLTIKEAALLRVTAP
jgi:hypothetical protein